MNGKEKQQSDPFGCEEALIDELCTLWLINDDFNTFEFVIENLVELCRHSFEQAMQCALITHNHGKCDILKGVYDELETIANIMLNRGLTVEITH
ncbi:MAG: ATP-dependent Clp protease adaptor ClpS [Bacteroidales bacterium]|jgi:ATP-dependent Clp protease adaptor protein ClpS|nr:ATP-dependent Clp protease adaptor ClpS [Bacteroidales bacterium]